MTQPKDPKRIKNSPPTWRTEVSEHYAELSMPKDVHEDFTQKLLALNLNQSEVLRSAPARSILSPASHVQNLGRHSFSLSQVHRSGFGYLLSSVFAAASTFAIMTFQQEVSIDPIVELANQAGPKAFPADFDLEGDPDSFAQFMRDVFPQQEFTLSQLPKEVMRGYRPSEGRFFTWSGQPGVSIQLLSPPTKLDNGSNTLLYIVQLGDSNSKGFPKEQKVTRNYTSKAGKQKRVKAWRDDKFGYAMVQSVALNDELRP
jgi:hypothetical protein